MQTPDATSNPMLNEAIHIDHILGTWIFLEIESHLDRIEPLAFKSLAFRQ